MATSRRAVGSSVVLVVLILVATAVPPAAGQPLSLEQQEAFLKNANIVSTRSAGKGVTGTIRATLSDGVTTHDASIQTVDVSMQEFKSNRGVEFNFRDSWRYNVAAYRLNRILQLGHVPPSVERLYDGKPGAFTWWVDDVLMDEGERLKKKPAVPQPLEWNRQMWHVRLFDQLIYNVDRNVGNLLIDKRWNVWMIDHSRAFRLHDKVKSPKNLSGIERGAFERLKALSEAALDEAIGDYLTVFEKRALLKRRDHIVSVIEKLGPAGVFDAVPVTQ